MNATKYKTVSLLLTVAVMTACSKTAQLTTKQSLDDKAQEPKASQQMPAMKGTGPLQPEDTNPFSFVAFGDSQGETNNPTLRAIFKDMETVTPKPSFALSLGLTGNGRFPLTEAENPSGLLTGVVFTTAGTKR